MSANSTPRRRRCIGTNRRGEPCGAAPLKGREACSAHDESHPDEERFGSSAWSRTWGPLGGRPALPRPTDVARRLVEENVLAILQPFFLTLGYDVVADSEGPRLVPADTGGAKLHATYEGDVIVSSHADLAAMIQAAERLLDRVYGKPRQALEHTGAGGGPIELDGGGKLDLRKLSDTELDHLEDLVRRATPGT